MLSCDIDLEEVCELTDEKIVVRALSVFNSSTKALWYLGPGHVPGSSYVGSRVWCSPPNTEPAAPVRQSALAPDVASAPVVEPAPVHDDFDRDLLNFLVNPAFEQAWLATDE
eukprot:scaffold17950_cov99-Amphora_coffeaeformis.AAC.1